MHMLARLVWEVSREWHGTLGEYLANIFELYI